MLDFGILLLLCWFCGVAFHVGGGLIHLLFVAAFVVFVFHFNRSGRSV